MNNRLILKTTNILFSDQEYKVNHLLLPSSLASTLSFRDYDILNSREDNNIIGTVYISGYKSVTEANNLEKLNTIKNLRSANKNTLPYISGSSNSLVERIPVHYHISETLDMYKRVKNDFAKKTAVVNYYSEKFYDPDFAINTYMFGKYTRVIPTVIDGVRRIEGKRINYFLSGYIKVENTVESTNLFLIVRGIPLPMKRTLTSRTGNYYNYIFTYPQYIVDNREIIESIQYIEIEGFGENSQYYFGMNYSFLNDDQTFGEVIANTHIINRNGRNISDLIV